MQVLVWQMNRSDSELMGESRRGGVVPSAGSGRRQATCIISYLSAGTESIIFNYIYRNGIYR